MAAQDRIEPLERLLNLVGLLLETRQPLTFEQIRETLEPYGQENVDTAKRMFERDKDLLRDYGVPLELVDVDAWGSDQGYLIPKEKYYLPEIAFTAEEMGALLVAAQSGGENSAAEAAVRKLVYGADGGALAGLSGGPLASGSDARSVLVLAAADAVDGNRRVRFGYRTSQGQASEREVDAYAMVYRGGHWYLVGHDTGRDDIRAFRLSRFTSEMEDVGEGRPTPQGFHAADHVDAGPWAADSEERARVAFAPEVAWSAAGALAGAVPGPVGADGWMEFEIPMADEEVLASLLLQFGPEAEALEPPSLRETIVRRLEAAIA
jgi:predicted DNA-binding transcriptional regulator YafY